MIGRAITALKAGAIPLNYHPLYGGSYRLTLQQVLFGSDLKYPISSEIKGYWVDDLLTLEEFLVGAPYPQWVEKSITISYGQNSPTSYSVRELFVRDDILYMRVVKLNSCHGPSLLALKAGAGLETLPVALINYLELEGGERWRITF